MAELRDTYFRRLFVPVVISILALCLVATIVVMSPGIPVKWETSSTVLGSAIKPLAGGFRKLFL